MEQHPDPDAQPVYHDGRAETAAEGRAARDPLADWPKGDDVPQPFALYPEEDAPLDGILDPDDVVAWGLEFADEAVVYLRDPWTGRRTHGRFGSAERARTFFSRWGALRLVRP